MQLTDNTILITGGGSGIGRGLAESFQALGNKVIIAGRRQQVLDETVAANPGMIAMSIDLTDPAHIRSVAAEIATKYPTLNVLINNAGIMRAEKLTAQPDDLADAEATVVTNLLAPIRLTAALLPLLQKTALLCDYECLLGTGICPVSANADLLCDQISHSLIYRIATLSTAGISDRSARINPAVCGDRLNERSLRPSGDAFD